MPALLIERLLKVAVPPLGVAAVVPPSVAPDVPVPLVIDKANVELLLAVPLITRFPKMSCTCTTTAGVMVAFTAVFEGWAKKTSFDAPASVVDSCCVVLLAIAPNVEFVGAGD